MNKLGIHNGLPLGVKAAIMGAIMIVLSASSALAQSTDHDGFFKAAPDVPLLPGFEELADQQVAFDKPEGRIVYLVATGAGDQQQIGALYHESLQAFGWNHAGYNEYTRDAEHLVMTIDVLPAGVVRVEFEVAPLAPLTF